MKILLLIFLTALPFIESCQNSEDDTTEPPEQAKVITATKSPKTNSFAQQADKFFKDKSISKPVKGAVIGAAAGALTGAAVAKNDKAKGAIVGTAVGTGVGIIAGAAVEKKQKDGKLFKKGLFKKKKNKNATDEY